ncbi:HRDC domain-containing protein [Saxibacter everestensis]|uniref:HRDC domain-containing protein n=1 Tax=Saxibacter everestensis TaxID=2909229 RepID=A0ABY8QYM8_9MICO|nr:HRDC domain-containing protein [Brevibacteriaceae bacterium ZFBP1038]
MIPEHAADLPAESAEELLPLLAEPSGGVPPVLTSTKELGEATAALAIGHGPVAIDAERASGYRYGQRAFLVQLRRQGAGSFLIDPQALPDLSQLNQALADIEWVLHAATQDLPCLAELGMTPTRLFDTELAARLLNWPKVGLGAVVERVLGLRLAKEHSAVDWSTRPLPEPWLRYAALDVEVLVKIRDRMTIELQASGKAEWAAEEFDHARRFIPAQRAEPWRRLSGIHSVRRPRNLAVARSLWESREQLARDRDVSPGRLLPDSAIVGAAKSVPSSPGELLGSKSFNGRAAKSEITRWYSAVEAGLAVDESELPAVTVRTNNPPPPRLWAEKDPQAAARLGAAKLVIADLVEEYDLPPENLLTPDFLRRLCWRPPEEISEQSVATSLSALGARNWQLSLVAGPLTEALRNPGLSD